MCHSILKTGSNARAKTPQREICRSVTVSLRDQNVFPAAPSGAGASVLPNTVAI